MSLQDGPNGGRVRTSPESRRPLNTGNTYAYFNLTSNVNGRIRSWPGQYSTDVTARQTQNLIDRFHSDGAAAPWFIWWAPIAPHHGGPFEPMTLARRRETTALR